MIIFDQNGNEVTNWSGFEGYYDSKCDEVEKDENESDEDLCAVIEAPDAYCFWDGDCKGGRKCNAAALQCEGESNCDEEESFTFTNCEIVEQANGSCFW